jgi:hypothetical protein
VWKPAAPLFAAPSMGDAVTWCCEALARKGVPRSPRLVELHRALTGPPRSNSER